MAIRSLFLSLTLTGLLGYCFTVGLTDPNSLLKKIPEWLGISLLVGFFFLYLLATWWAVKGFSAHKITAILSMGFCVFGLGLYALAFTMEFGRGRATPGQYDHDFSTLDVTEKAVVAQIVHEAGLRLENAVFTAHWTMAKANNTMKGFGICVQKGHVTALDMSNHAVPNLAPYSKLPALGDLYLKNCALSDMSGLRSEKLDRLDVSYNQITDLKTLRGCPNVRWLFMKNNRLTSTDGLTQFRDMVSTDFTGNPIP